MQQEGNGTRLGEQERLFLCLIEQLSRPLLQIAHTSELSARTAAQSALHWQLVQTMAQSSLQLVESYALSLRLHGNVMPLELEPVTVSSLLYDTAQALQPYAKQYAVELELETGSKTTYPVLADRSVLQSALVSLGQVFVQAQSGQEDRAPVRLAAHRSRYGVVAGLYGQASGLGADSLRRAQRLHGETRQPFAQLVNGPAAGVFVADSLLKTLSAHLHVARYRNLTGLATTLQPSSQLQLI
jgi:hypothetical protein